MLPLGPIHKKYLVRMFASAGVGTVVALMFRAWDTQVLIPARENFYREREAAIRAKKAKSTVPQPTKH